MDGEKPKKERSEAQKRLNQSLRNAKARINAAGKQWHPSKAPAIAALIRKDAPKANIDAKIAELENAAVKEEKKAVKAAAASAKAAAAGNAVASAKNAANAAGAAAKAGVLKAAAKAGTAKKPVSAKAAAYHNLQRQASQLYQTAKKKHSPKRFAALVAALRAGNNAGADAVLNSMANAANEKAANVGAAAAAGVSKANQWQANIKKAREQLKRNRGAAANQHKYGIMLASALRKGNDASVAAAMNRINKNIGTRNAKKAAKKPAGNNKTKKNAAPNPFNVFNAPAPVAKGPNPFNNSSSNSNTNKGPKANNPFNNF